jgi:hypothetical protein
MACGTLDPPAITLVARQQAVPVPSAATAMALRSPDGLRRSQVDLTRYNLDSLAERSA